MCQKGGKTANSASKKKRDELDKISNLPSGVTQQILSFLPIREAVRTSILSSNWRHKWAMVWHLVFDDQCVSDMMRGGIKRTKTFENIVDHVLLLHSGSIDTFKLSS
ncbi:putative F-box domain-containing protein [Rosa chinensis]|uniref:Putative F-box domain-containing protein n=1 Tax=Rosa chinensis TaxID=74649 RepID=A0A2P6QY78_ROSCH|nr:putative F-box domain-containing protein [Rosa chinensis]